MPKRIAIIPTFASSHFLKCWIPNVIDVIKPDIIIINEGLFPNGPEDKGNVDSQNFIFKYSFRGVEDGNTTFRPTVGFDWLETKEICSKYLSVKLESMSYPFDMKVDECFLHCMTYFGDFAPEIGDLIFPLEPDAFHHELDSEIIEMHLKNLQPGQGLKTKWVDFLETQFYTEAINIVQPKYRRFVYCFDNMENYKEAINGFKSQNYPKLKQVDDFITYHYPWFVFDKWKELRFDLIHRPDPQYWKDFEKGLLEIKRWSEELVFDMNCEVPGDESGEILEIPIRIPIRPSRHDEGRWAKFIDIDHPKHIQSHPNFIK